MELLNAKEQANIQLLREQDSLAVADSVRKLRVRVSCRVEPLCVEGSCKPPSGLR